MSVSRTAARLIAALAATGALVGAAAMPAMAVGHDRDNGRSYHLDVRSGHDHDGRYGDWYHRHHGRYHHPHWYPGWYNDRPWDRYHGWYGDRYRDHDHRHYFGHR
ncbi:hypothetical protein [Streptomyces sp. NPDC001020]